MLEQLFLIVEQIQPGQALNRIVRPVILRC